MTERFYYKSPIGNLKLILSDKGLQSMQLVEHTEQISSNHSLSSVIIQQLDAYFNKTLKSFDLPLDWENATDFEKSVWDILLKIPYGKTISYSAIAEQLGNPKSVRAVGTANGRNPIPIIVPCHRVIGKNGQLTGFALGLDIKAYLLNLENPQRFAQQGKLF